MGTPRSTRLLGVLTGFRRVLVVTHDNPDPDAIAAGWALLWLIREKVCPSVRLIGGGAIIRAENRHMVKLLGPPIELVDEIAVADDTAAILIDCSSAMSNHLLANAGIQPLAVIDHHEMHGARGRLPFRDIRPRLAASATIAASYLREQALEPSRELATALLYAIRTETHGSEIRYSREDRRVVNWLNRLTDPEKLAAIENAPLTREHFSDLVLALQSTFVYDSAALCFLPRVEGAETVGEVADMLVRCEHIDRVLCAAVVGCDMLVSFRAGHEAGNAAELAHKTLAGLGLSGGHERRAGGRIRVPQCGLNAEQLMDELRNRWLTVCNIDRQRGTRLVARREIVKNL